LILLSCQKSFSASWLRRIVLKRIDVIATTISGSIADWKKVERIVPLFAEHGYSDVRLHEVDSHAAARAAACNALTEGGRIPISAGGSGTFRAVLEGCIDSGVELADVRLGFLRKGSADLIGKVLHMPDEIERAIRVFAESITADCHLPADILRASCESSGEVPRHFIGYGGAELFGRIPYYTENRWTKYYKGILSQFFGDLGPFMTGVALALIERLLKAPFQKKPVWQIMADGQLVAEDAFQALILVNGYLGPDLPYSDQPLGSGEFYCFGLRNLGASKLLAQIRHARDGSIMDDPKRCGLVPIVANDRLELIPGHSRPFPVNVDGGTFMAKESMYFERVGQIPLIANKESA
jgi:diacylglycerol kinase family enzyme